MKNKEYKNFDKISKTKYSAASTEAFYIVSTCQKKYSGDKYGAYATSECMQRSSRLLDIQDETVLDITLS